MSFASYSEHNSFYAVKCLDKIVLPIVENLLYALKKIYLYYNFSRNNNEWVDELMEHKQLLELFPAFMEIQDKMLRMNALKAMANAMENGGWDFTNIDKCPVTMNWMNCDVSWIEHVTDVTNLCIDLFQSLSKYYERHKVVFRRDYVICGALLHDIGKLTEYKYVNGELAHATDYELLRHPLLVCPQSLYQLVS